MTRMNYPVTIFAHHKYRKGSRSINRSVLKLLEVLEHREEYLLVFWSSRTSSKLSKMYSPFPQ